MQAIPLPPDIREPPPIGWLRCALRTVWIARISVISVLVSFLLFYGVEQVQDLFLDSRPWWHWIVFYLAAAVFWLIPVHHSARSLLHLHHAYIRADTETRFFVLVEIFPRLLVLAGLASIALGQWLALANVPEPEKLLDDAAFAVREARLTAGILLATTIAILVLTALIMFWPPMKHATTSFLRTRFSGALNVLHFAATALFGSSRIAPPDDHGRVRAPFFKSKTYEQETVESYTAALVLAIILAIVFVLCWLNPLRIWDAFRLSTMLVIILGAWIPLFHFGAFLSWRFKLPVTTMAVVLFVILSSIFVLDNPDIRLLEKGSQGAQVSLNEAVDLWKKNNCADDACVRPIIVVAEGGASREAYFVGNLLGHIEDLSQKGDGSGRKLHQQIFAISAVSGGALGSAAYVAAVRARHDGKLSASGFRHSLKKVLDGDFLTPSVVRQSFGDVFRGVLPIDDRAAILEQAWEERFAERIHSDTNEKGLLSEPFLSFGPTAERWLPLLIFNGTSTANGRRILTSTLDLVSPSKSQSRSDERIITDASDITELRCAAFGKAAQGVSTPPTWLSREPRGCPCQPAGDNSQRLVPTCDIRLSTAVMNSARFPFVSSRGTIKNAEGQLVDYIVDGGHFDASGIVAADELARVLVDEHRLDPFMLFISSDPRLNPEGCRDLRKRVNTADPDRPVEKRGLWLAPRPPSSPDGPRDTTLLPAFFGPLDTVMEVRTARNFHVMWTFQTRIGMHSLAYAQVCPNFGKTLSAASLSMSWWLSRPVLAYLDSQVQATHNAQTVEDIQCLLSEPLLEATPAAGKLCRTGVTARERRKPKSSEIITGTP